MAAGRSSGILEHVLRAALAPDGAGLPDGKLLEGYVVRREEAAFEALVRRHGPMVLGVCRRVLGNVADAEDAFQATFLVLVRKAASVAPRERVGNWLYGVAYHTALKARAAAVQRRRKERQVGAMHVAEAPEEIWEKLHGLLDQELHRLPDKYRVPIVLCELEGKTRKEAARQLGWAEGTVASRLSRGRVLLARRMSRHGLALSGGTLALALAGRAAMACPPTLVVSTLKVAAAFAAGPAAAGAIPAKIVALTKGVLQTMLLSKLKLVAAVIAALAVAALGGALLYRAQPRAEAAAPASAAPAQAADDPDKAAAKDDETLKITLAALEKALYDAGVKQDADGYGKFLADDYVGFSVGHRYTKEDNVRGVRAARISADYKMSDMELIRLNEKAAIISYKGEWKVLSKDGDVLVKRNRRVSTCWVQRGGGWVIAFSQDMPIGPE
jgi:RNA polymerase sigma factor (sigma-70 family)